MFSSRARNRSRSSPPVGSFGRIGGSSSRAPPIESPRPAAAKHKPHLQAFRPQDDSSLQNTILLGAIRPLRHSPFRLLHGRLLRLFARPLAIFALSEADLLRERRAPLGVVRRDYRIVPREA